MSSRQSWTLIGTMVVVLIVCVLATVDVARIAGFVRLFIAVAIGMIARLGIQTRRRSG